MFKSLPIELNELIFEYLPIKDLVKYLNYDFVHGVIKRKIKHNNTYDDVKILVYYPKLIISLIDYIEKDIILLSSAKHGQLEVMQYILSRDRTIFNICYNYLLNFSSRAGHLIIVKYLLSQFSYSYKDKEYALINSAKEGHIKVLKYLVSLGVNFRTKQDYALVLATHYRHKKVIQYLLHLGADHNAYKKWIYRRNRLNI